MATNTSNESVYDVIIRLAVIVLIVGWCLMIMLPFVNIILWGFIFGIAFKPLHTSLSKLLGNSPKLASSLIVLVSLAIIIVPSIFFIDSIINSVTRLKESYQAGSIVIPPPSESVKSWPIVGKKIYAIWATGNPNIEKFVIEYREQLGLIGKKLLSGILSTTSGLIQMIGAIIIAGILLIVKDLGESIRKFFRKIAGENGDYYADIIRITIGNVVKGVLGVALIQALICGVGFLLADIPFAGLWTLLVLILAILQLPPMVITIPIIIYMFTVKEPVPAILWTVYLFLAGISDNILKPILLAKGAPVPMLVIFIGVVGGFIFSGFIGLFTGAVIMSIGYKLYVGWVNPPSQKEIEAVISDSKDI